MDAAIAVAAKLTDVCLWHKTDITIALNHVRFLGVRRTSVGPSEMSANDPKRKSSITTLPSIGIC